MLDGVIRIENGSSEEYALNLLCKAADNGYLPARGRLNRICQDKYREQVSGRIRTDNSPAPLTDFEGSVFRIDRTGVMTPVDAKLDFINGQNILTLSVNIYFLSDSLENEDRFAQAVLAGIKEWEGNYQVFGNQNLIVRVELTCEPRIWDGVLVLPVTKDRGSQMQTAANILGSKKRQQQMEAVLENKRSFAGAGFKWSVYSRKWVYIMSESGNFDEYEELQAVAKHEFGHVLGLGDLYKSTTDALEGVEHGTYPELDGYHISNKFYNLVMCDHHGPVSNNDIEMVVLAFRDNKAQLYQPSQFKGIISKALGKGN